MRTGQIAAFRARTATNVRVTVRLSVSLCVDDPRMTCGTRFAARTHNRVSHRNRIDVVHLASRMRGERKRSVSATRMDVRLVFAREQCVSIACDHVRNSRALSHPRIVFFDKLHVGCVSMRVPLPNPCIERASVVNAQAHNDVSCRKPA